LNKFEGIKKNLIYSSEIKVVLIISGIFSKKKKKKKKKKYKKTVKKKKKKKKKKEKKKKKKKKKKKWTIVQLEDRPKKTIISRIRDLSNKKFHVLNYFQIYFFDDCCKIILFN